MRDLKPLAAAALLAACAPTAGAAGLDPRKSLTQYNLDVWTTANGLPQNTVTSVVQTKDGYLWLGTFGGLARFDGARFRVFDRGTTPALRNSGIQALLADRDGGLWVGTNGGGLTHLEDGVFTTYTTEDGLAGDVVRSLHQDEKGALWVGTNGGLSRLESGRFRSWTTKEGLSENVVRAIQEDGQGALWIGTNGGGLCRLKDEAFRCWRKRDGLPSDFVFTVLADREGAVWVGTNGGGLARFRDGRVQRVGEHEGLSGDVIWALYEDGGSLWVGTYGAGLFRLEGERFRGLNTTSGLGSDFVRALCRDREGSLWIGTNNGGLARLRDGKFTTYTVREGLPSDVVKTVLADREGSLWIGTSGGGLARLKDGVFAHYGPREGLPHEFVTSLLVDRKGSLWVGTNGGGLARLENGRFRVLTARDGLADDHVSTVSEDRDGSLWVGTNAGGLSHLVGGRFTSLTRHEGLAANLVLSTLVDHEDVVWVGTDGGGLTRIQDGKLTSFTMRDGLPADTILSLAEDEEGAIWIGTSGGGLARLQGGRFASWSTRDGLQDDVVFATLEDGHGGLWLTGNRGISRVEKASLRKNAEDRRVPLQAVLYGLADGLKSSECGGVSQPAATRGPDGKLYFPTTRGIVTIDPSRIPMNAQPPPVHVEALEAGGVRRDARDPIELPPGVSNWEIRYTALSLIAPERVRFRYRLLGLDEQWVEAGTRRTAFYTKVPPGRYTFQVIACNNDGAWNETGDRVEITLLPRFYETRPFYAALALCLALGIGLSWRAHVRGLDARRRSLEALVETRTRELSERKEEAERLREQAERQTAIAQEASALKTQLLSIAAHDLKNPLSMVLGYADMALAKLGPEVQEREYLRLIQSAAERMLGILTRLLDAAALESGRITLEAERVSLAAVARAVVEMSRPAAARKDQGLTLAVEAEPLVIGDEERLREVLDNLLSNAIKYSPRGTPIRVRVYRSASRAVCEVQDEGPGLTDEDKPKLFGRFQRLSAQPTGGEPSTGLGLSIAKQLVELHEGRLWAESDGPGRGSRFGFDLPVVQSSNRDAGLARAH